MGSKSSPREWIRDLNALEEVGDLNEGTYGTVTLFANPQNQDVIAVKTFRQPTEGDPKNSAIFTQEVENLIRLSHPCILPIVGYSLPTTCSPGQIATKYATNGSLRDALDKRKEGTALEFMSETGKAIIIVGIVLGMKFAHSKCMIHGDLKPENIFLDDRGHVQIGDFGNSRFFDLGLTERSQIGTPLYMAPEMYQKGDCTTAVDVYSFSLILYELVSGEPVFPSTITSTELKKQVLNGIRPEVPEIVNQITTELIEQSWSVDPIARPSFDQILDNLQQNDFKISTRVERRRVREFVSLVEQLENQQVSDFFTPASRSTPARVIPPAIVVTPPASSHPPVPVITPVARPAPPVPVITPVVRPPSPASSPLPVPVITPVVRPPSPASSPLPVPVVTPAAHISEEEELDRITIDELYQYLMKHRYQIGAQSRLDLDQTEISIVCKVSQKVLLSDPILLQLDTPIHIIGDLHGNFEDLVRFVEIYGFPSDTCSERYLFLGDYVDRGDNSLETIILLLCAKILFPTQIYLLRGNHETREMTENYGFKEECLRYYDTELWEQFLSVFDYLPLAAIVGQQKRIFCVHGGLSPDMPDPNVLMEIKRPYTIPEEGFTFAILWSDPSKEVDGYVPNERASMSYKFGLQATQEFLKKNNFELLCRAHECVMEGLCYPLDPDKSVVTVFSATDYGHCLHNQGAMLSVTHDDRHEITVLDPTI